MKKRGSGRDIVHLYKKGGRRGQSKKKNQQKVEIHKKDVSDTIALHSWLTKKKERNIIVSNARVLV